VMSMAELLWIRLLVSF